MTCLDDATMLEIAEGQRPIDVALAGHLATCPECRLVLAAAARGNGQTLRDHVRDETEPSWEELGAGVVVAKRYELTRFLGSGGMGVVWAARAEGGPDVALKIARSADPELARRFQREARITAGLAHPNIVRTFEVLPAHASRGPILVQELLEGESLEALLVRRTTLDLREAARTLLPVLDALAAAHATGIVHRDLKPHNVFMTPSRVVVLDFGIAKMLPEWGPHSRLTRTGAILGTPCFMAPEQLEGENDVDARADVWALGVMLFRMLMGRCPVAGRGVGEILKNLQQGRIEDIGVAPGLPTDIVALTRNALVIDRSRRISDVASFRRALEKYA